MRLLLALLSVFALAAAESPRLQINRIAATLALGQHYGELSAADANARLTQQAAQPADPAAWKAALVRLSDRLLNDATLAAQNTTNAFDRDTNQRRAVALSLSFRSARDNGGDLFEPLAELAALAGRPNPQLFSAFRAEATRLLQIELSRTGPGPQPQSDWSSLAGDWTGYFANAPTVLYPQKIVAANGQLTFYGARQPNNPNDMLASRVSIDAAGNITATEYGLNGRVSADRNRIDWANGAVWVRGAQAAVSNRFPTPRINGLPVDQCLNFGVNCGQPAADAFCRYQRFSSAESFAVATTARTHIIGDNRTCAEPSSCVTLTNVVCRAGSVTPIQTDWSSLAGDWTGYYANAPTVFYPEKIVAANGQLTFYGARQPNNPNDMLASRVSIDAAGSITAPEYGVNGRVSADRNRIDWSNGAVWIRGAQPAANRFPAPQINGIPVDQCLTYSANCGQPAADAFCRSQRFGSAESFTTYLTTRTYVIGDNQQCQANNAVCGALANVVCRAGANPQPQPDWSSLAGDWTGYYANAPTVLYPQKIVAANGQLTFYGARQPNNPNDMLASRVSIDAAGNITATEYGLNGRVSADRNRIDWTNGAVWVRGGTAPPRPGPNSNTNLALGKPTTTSSRSTFSTPSESGAVDGVKNGGFGFHTDNEPNPWWTVDLQQTATLGEIRVFNRADGNALRARTMRAFVSTDGTNWQQVYDQAGRTFGADGLPLRIPLNNVPARWVRLQLNELTWFHLDEVEIYGTGTGGAPPPASDLLGRVWRTREHSYIGVWTRRGTSNVFDGTRSADGSSGGTSELTMTLDGNLVTIDRPACRYTGTITGLTVSGLYNGCNGSGNLVAPWSAVIDGAAPPVNPGVPPLPIPPPAVGCANPRTIALMDQWIAQARPILRSGDDLRYEPWGRLVGRTATAIIRPMGSPDTRLTRCEWLWQYSSQMNSTNLGTLRDFVVQGLR